MSNSVFKKWTSAVLYLNEKIKSGRLIAGRNIQLENTGFGIRINSVPANRPGDNSYNGYFKVIQTAPNKIKIVDGLADYYTAATIAGDALISDTLFNDIAAKEFTITANSWIYLISTGAAPTLQAFTSRQAYELGKSKTLISRVKFADSKISKFSQEVHGMIYGNIDGSCN